MKGLVLIALIASSLACMANPMTYYVNSVEGSNENSGISPEEAWADFSPINGKTLQAGERLLIKRGSVINQELQVGALGTEDAWVKIGAYGEGTRPSIRRNWDIHERCAYIKKSGLSPGKWIDVQLCWKRISCAFYGTWAWEPAY